VSQALAIESSRSLNYRVDKQCLIYARVSSKEQEREGYSIDAQVKLLRLHAGEQGLEVVKEFTEAESAKGEGRKSFNAMLKYLEANPIVRHLLCEKTDRLSRNFRDIATLDKLMNDGGLIIHLVKENAQMSADSKSHEKFMFGIKALMAKNYCDNLSEEVKKGMREKAEQGEYPGGTVAYGYRRDRETGRIVQDPERAHLIPQIYQLYADNQLSLRGLAKWARERSLTTPRSGRPITMNMIERILKNPFYYGIFQWNGRLYPGNHEPLISKGLFDRANASFHRVDKVQSGRKKFAFGNLMTCARCGCKITAERKKGKYVYYRCTGMRGGCDLEYVREERIVEQFESFMGPLVMTHDEAQEVLEELTKDQRKSDQRIEAEQLRIRKRLTQLDTWTEKAYMDRLEGLIADDQWKKLSVQWDAERVDLQSQLAQLDNENPDFMPTALSILELSQKLPALWDAQNNFEKRKLVDLLYSNSQLNGATLSLTYKKPFNYIAEGHQSQKKRG